MPLYWLKNDWEDALAASTDAAVKHKSKTFRLISISSTPQISLPGKARSRAPFRDCPSTSCLFHCSNAHVRQGCGIGCRRVQDRRSSSKADHEPERLRANNCRHFQYPEDQAIPKSENRTRLNRAPRRPTT